MKLDSHSSRLRRVASILAFAAPCSAALAHPGHSISEGGLSHAFRSPYHLAVLAGAGLALLGTAWFIRQETPRRAVQCAGVVALASAVLLWGIGA